MNVWIAVAIALLFLMAICFLRAVHGDAFNRLVATQAANMMAVLVLLLLAEGFRRLPFVDLSLALAFLSFGGTLVFVRFLERWL